MPVPPQCQSIVDEIERLKEELEDVGGLSGAELHQAAAHNFHIRQQMGLQAQKLNACILAFGPGYSTEVVVLDLTPGGGNVTYPLEGTLWRLTGGPAFAIEQRTVQAGKLTFVHGPTDPSGAPLAISIDEAPNATFTGPLFRSNPSTTLPAGSPGNPTGAITIVIPGPTPVSAATIAAGLTPAAIPPVPGLTITSVTPTLGSGMITITITGRALGTFPLTYTYNFTLVPTRDMTAVATTVCDVVPTAGMIASASPLGIVGGLLTSAVEPLLRAAVTPAVAGLVNSTIFAAAATALGRPLTSFETISMRRVVIAPSGINFFPTIGTYGP
jgi:hypothetical protein